MTHIHRLVVKTGTNLRHMLDYFGVAQLQDIRATDFARVVRSLEKRRTA